MIITTTTSPFDAPPAGRLVAVELDPRRQLARRAIAGYLAGYSSATLDAYRLDLRQWVTWLDGNGAGWHQLGCSLGTELLGRPCATSSRGRAVTG